MEIRGEATSENDTPAEPRNYGANSGKYDMELKLTTPRGLYFLLLIVVLLIEVVVGAIEVARYVGLL